MNVIRTALKFYVICLPIVVLHGMLRGPEAVLWTGGVLALFCLQIGVFLSDGWHAGEEQLWAFADRHAWFGWPLKLLMCGLIVVGLIYCGLYLWDLTGDIVDLMNGRP